MYISVFILLSFLEPVYICAALVRESSRESSGSHTDPRLHDERHSVPEPELCFLLGSGAEL